MLTLVEVLTLSLAGPAYSIITVISLIAVFFSKLPLEMSTIALAGISAIRMAFLIMQITTSFVFTL